MAGDSGAVVNNCGALRASVAKTRFPWGLWTIFFLPYLPFGIILCLWRSFISLQAILLLLIIPESVVKRYMLRMLFCVLGMLVFTKGRVAKTKLLVSNKVSLLDHIALHLAAACVTMSAGNKTPPLAPLFPHWSCPSTDDDKVLEAAQALPEFRESGETTTPYLVQPEPYPTTAKHSLLKFCVWPFSLSSSVQPVALSLTHPSPVSLSPVHGSGWLDLLCLFFFPVTIFHVHFLSVVHKAADHSPEESSCHVQKEIASSLGINTSQLTVKDVQEWLTKRPPPAPTPPKHEDSQASSQETRGFLGAEMEGLEAQVHQVTSVLPQVPHTVIRADLRKTKSVDVTITNLLEGHVPYTPSTSPTFSSLTSSSNASSSVLRRRGNAAQRQLSLEERKRELLDNAKRRYKEKHSL